MSISKDESLRENSKVMLSNLVYHQEYRDVFVSLLRNYNEVMQVSPNNVLPLFLPLPPSLPPSFYLSHSNFFVFSMLDTFISLCTCGGSSPLRPDDGTLLSWQQSHDRTAEEEKGEIGKKEG